MLMGRSVELSQRRQLFITGLIASQRLVLYDLLMGFGLPHGTFCIQPAESLHQLYSRLA